MSEQPVDQSIRDELLTPTESFIVQAPAGSGKTELLTQRILALLALVEKPENILAITFTRKAAAEMRTRVISALQLGQGTEPEQSHEKQRWQLARKVLQRDRELNWNLLRNSARLNITTIDSLSASLSSALPLLSQTGALPKIAENASRYYQEAADNLLLSISDGDQTAENIKRLLRHKDNNLAQVSELLAQMLSRRLQWLTQVKSHAQDFNLEQYQQSLSVIAQETLQKTYRALPADIVAELPDLLTQAARVCGQNNVTSKPNLCGIGDVAPIGLPYASDVALWKAIAELFLKAGNKPDLLSSFTRLSGFPTAKDAADQIEKEQFARNKKMVTAIASQLRQTPGLAELLLQIKLLADPRDSLSHQLSLESVVALLPVAVAHLKLVFSQYNVIDFSELSLASLEALGHPEMPSDLALALDYRLDHILIDEFQDTSTPQVALLESLIAGWELQSGRSLFLVGDPMQSIYRFRDANVSLFMQICRRGVGDIKPKFRQLKVNFRSSAGIVNWVNRQFSQIMPEHNDETFAAVSYAPSVAFDQQDDKTAVQGIFTLGTSDDSLEAAKIIQLVKEHLAKNQQSGQSQHVAQKQTLAILARSRNHLKTIIELLNRHAIEYQAVEIDRLSQKPVVRDLTRLAYALSDQFDQLSWAACMRAPWFGLSLDSIRLVFMHTDPSLSFPQRICQSIPLMNENCTERSTRVMSILQLALDSKGKKPFRKWLYGCFLALGGLSQLDFQSERDDLLACLDKLSELTSGGELNDREAVEQAIEQLFAAPNPKADGQVQIMTIHKAKGLEFDTVILPRLHSKARSGDPILLKWTEFLDSQGHQHNLLALSKKTGEEQSEVYRYITYLDAEKAKYEEQRLLYVAATRAKNRLILLAGLASDDKADDGIKRPGGRSFLSMLWPQMESNYQLVSEGDLKDEASNSTDPLQMSPDPSLTGQAPLFQSRYVKRGSQTILKTSCDAISNELADEAENESTQSSLNDESEENHADLSLISPMATAIGRVLHRQLQWLTEKNQTDKTLAKAIHTRRHLPDNWPEICAQQLRQEYPFESPESLAAAVSVVTKGLDTMLDDEVGRLILSCTESAGSEVVLHKKLSGGNYLTRIVDRTFVHENTRWIVDYKSSQPEKGQSFDSFIAQEKERYFNQIEDYFKLFLAMEKRPIIAGLYFPLLGYFEKMLDSAQTD